MIGRPTFTRAPGLATHPDIWTVKAVSGVVALSRAASRRGLPLADPAQLQRLETLTGSALALARDPAVLPNPTSVRQELDLLLHRLTTLTNGARVGSDGRDPLEDFLVAVASEIGDFPPEDCICRGYDVTGPWSYIDGLFDFALTSVERSYRRLRGGGRSIPIAARLHAIPGPGTLREAKATTSLVRDRPEARAADITLHLSKETFSGDDYFGLVGRLHHELFVHSVQCVGSGGKRTAFGPRCAMAEGFIDRASHLVLRNALKDRLPMPLVGIEHEIRKRVDVEHETRGSYVAGSDLNERSAADHRRYGRRLFDVITERRGGDEQATIWCIDLAMALNVWDLAANERMQLFVSLHSRMEPPMKGIPTTLGDLDDVVMRGRDPRDLIL